MLDRHRPPNSVDGCFNTLRPIVRQSNMAFWKVALSSFSIDDIFPLKPAFRWGIPGFEGISPFKNFSDSLTKTSTAPFKIEDSLTKN